MKPKNSKTLQGDFVKLVNNDCENIGLNMEVNEIKCVTKQMFKNIVKTKVQKATFEYLMTLKNTHSK